MFIPALIVTAQTSTNENQAPQNKQTKKTEEKERTPNIHQQESGLNCGKFIPWNRHYNKNINKLLLHATTWMNLQDTTLSEESQTRRACSPGFHFYKVQRWTKLI